MSKKYYCAKCGLKLEVIQKANPKEGTVMNLVKPHVCVLAEEANEVSGDAPSHFESPGAFEILDKKTEKKLDKKIDKLFDEFPFVKKLNKATAEHEVVTQESGDKRDKKHLREELVTSSAPSNILDMSARSNVKPAHDIKEGSNE